MEQEYCLEIENLSIDFVSRNSSVRVVEGMSLGVRRGETIGIVGESGCGKTMTALAVMGLIPSPPGRVTEGKILLNSEDILQVNEKRWRDIRGKKISMIFQEPMTSLNPVFTVGEQIVEMIRLHEDISKKDAWDRAIEILAAVEIQSPERRVKNYPHELSGGMRQRVMIAMALACSPEVLIADEPTTALDVTVQDRILELLRKIQEKTNTAIILITHDMGVVAETAAYVAVMYAGRKVEEGPVGAVIGTPQHPYTKGLIACIPVLNPNLTDKRSYLAEIPGMVPQPSMKRVGCPFKNRCKHSMPKCGVEMPPMFAVGEDKHVAACWLYS